MAEYTIVHKIESKFGNRTSASAKAAAGIDEGAIMRGVSKALEKALGRLSGKLSKQISDSIGKSISTALRKAGGGREKFDFTNEARKISNQVANDLAKNLVNAVSKTYVGGKGGADPTRAMNTLVRNLDKQISSAIGQINTAIQTKTGGKIQLDPSISKDLNQAITKSLTGIITKAIPRETGTALRQLGAVSKTLSGAVKELKDAAKSLKTLKITGGGIDLNEIPKVIQNFKKLGFEVKKVPDEFNKLRESTKKLIGDQKQIVAELNKAIKDSTKKIAEVAQSAKTTPTKFIPTAGAVKAESKKIIKDLSDELGKSIKNLNVEVEIKDLGKFQASADNLSKAIDTGSKKFKEAADIAKKAYQSSLPFGSAGRGAQAKKLEIPLDFKKSLDTLDMMFGRIIQGWGRKLQEQLTSAEIDPKGLTAINELSSDLTKFRQAFKEMDLSVLKEIAAKTSATGGDVLGKEVTRNLNLFRHVLVEMSKMISGTPEEIRSAIKDGLSDIKNIRKDITSGIDEGSKTIKEQVKKGISEGAKDFKSVIARTSESAERMIKDIAPRTTSRIRGPADIGKYPTGAILPAAGTVRGVLPAGVELAGEAARRAVEEKITSLANSLKNLQDGMVATLDAEFKEAGKGWDIVRDSMQQNVQDFFKLITTGNIKTAGKQFGFDIANVAAIKRELTRRGITSKITTSSAAVKELREALIEESVEKARGDFLSGIAKWLKSRTKEELKLWEGLSDFRGKLLEVKELDIKGKGVVPGKELIKALKERLTPGQVEEAFRATFGRLQAERFLREAGTEPITGARRAPFVRKISIPAARLTPTGTATFETARGSQRALPQFATFRTGFERIYDFLEKKQALVYGKGFERKIRRVGVRPTGPALTRANELAQEMLTDFAGTGEQAVAEVRKHVTKAATVRAAALDPASASKLKDEVGKALQTADLSMNMRGFINAIELAGLKAYDIVKAMDKIEFQNVYDIINKVITEGLQPLQALGKKPTFDKSIRDLETAINQVVQNLPLIEPGRPRRALHQESVLNLLVRTGGAFAKERGLSPEKQTEFLKDLNLRLKELIEESELTGEKILKTGQRTISTLGIPEAGAARFQVLKPGLAKESERFLTALGGISTKMSTEILPELAPFGAQFTQIGRNVASVTNALSASKAEIDRLTTEFGATATEGFGTQFPALRTQREAELIAGGRLGQQGYGFNVLAELRHTAGTFEDQILVSGKLADALTTVVKTLVKPSPGGRISRAGLLGAEAVEEIREGVVSDVAINKIFQEFQKVLGIPQRYMGQADKAFIDEVKKAITVVRGEEVEVQQARLTEVFLNYFGRKFVTRFGTKGVSVTPADLTADMVSTLGDALKALPEAKVKVLTPEERKKAGLGVALLPRSMGELLADVIDKYEERLADEDIDVSSLRQQLVDSGNKFILDLFKTPGLVTATEAKRQTQIFMDAVDALAKIGVEIKNDIAGIKGIRDLFKKEFGEEAPLFKERPIDVRISSVGVGKRGLQPEFMEAIVNNLIGAGPTGLTTVATKIPQAGKFGYEALLGGPGQRGALSEIAGALGFETIGKAPDIEQMLFERYIKAGKASDVAKVMAQRGAALEALSNYYTTIIDETGKARKSIVGEKFLSIVEEPGQFAATTAEEIRRGTAGVKIDVPVFAAYASVFGEQSKLLQEIKEGSAFSAKKNFEFLKALQFANDQSKELQARLSEHLDAIDVTAVKAFDQATGILADAADEFDPKSLAGTIFDIEKFPKPFLLQIPKATGKVGEKEPFYVPAPLARGTFAEELIAGERGFDVLARRLQHVVNMAKEAEELLQRPAQLQGEIEQLEAQMTQLVRAAKPEEAKNIERILQEKRADLERVLGGEGVFAGVARSKILERTTDLLKQAKQTTNVEEVTEILQTLSKTLSETEAPARAFKVFTGPAEIAGGVREITPISSELENLRAFLEKEIKVKGTPRLQALQKSVAKAMDLLVGQSPQAQVFYDKLIRGISEIRTGQTEGTSELLKELQVSLSAESRFRGKPLIQALEEKKRLTEPVVTATKKGQTALGRALREGKGAELAAKLGIDVEQTLQEQYFRKLDDLQKAKIDYFNTLAQVAVGKKGAITTTLFSKTIPGLMQKAIAATVDRTGELDKFKKDLQSIFEATDPSLIDLSDLENITKEINEIATAHAEKVAKQRAAGIPVLKQQEIGIPIKAAKKLPVKFARRFAFTEPTERGGMGRVEELRQPREVEKTLFDLLSYIDDLQNILKTGKLRGRAVDVGELGPKIQEHLEKEVFPYVEAIRYPFTGISSIVPYQAKLLTGRLGQLGGKSFAVPGAPEMDIAGFNNIVLELRDAIEKAAELREAEFKRADITGMAPDLTKIAKLNSFIDQLSQAISEAIPKYAAHTAKLDFDGDQVVVHAAKTKEAREEIKKHHDTLVNFNTDIEKGVPFGKTTQAIYRDIFTSEALLSQQPTGQAVLAEAAEAFYKKFPLEKGFEFLKKPFLTEELEFLKPGEKLGILGLGTNIVNAIEEIITENIRGAEFVPAGAAGTMLNKDLVLEAIKAVQTPFDTIEDELNAVKTAAGQTKRLKFAEQILQAVSNLDKQLGAQFSEQINKALTSKLFEERYRDAVTAQLFKIQTGIETEALYRINRLAEAQIGFGGGFIGGGGGFRPNQRFAARNPRNLGIVGPQPELDAQTFINELVRFAIQKGMDVKHAGERPLAGELVKHLAKGTRGVADLWTKIMGDESYSELLDFQRANEKAIRLRLGALPTEQIRNELEKLYKARGTQYDPAELAGAQREDLQQMVVEAVGLRGYLDELAIQLREAAIEGIIKDLKARPAHKRPKGAADIEAFARRTVQKQLEGEGINIREAIALPTSPLYRLRREAALAPQLAQFELRRGEIPVRGFEFRTKKPKEVEELIRKFKEARAVTANLQEGLQDALSSTSREAAAQMMRGAVDVLQAEQEEIDSVVQRLKTEGYDPEKIDRSIEGLKRRLLTGENIPTEILNLLKKKPKVRLARMERLAELAGLPTMGREEKLKLERELLSEFKAEGIKMGKAEELAPEELEAKASEFAAKMVDKAEILFEMDRILDALITRSQEGRFMVSLFKGKPTAAAAPKKSYAFEQKMREAGIGKKPGDIAANIPPGITMGTGGLYSGGIVPVHIASVAKDLAVSFGGSMAAPVRKEVDELLEQKAKIAEFKKTLVSVDPDIDYSKVFRASGLAGGGRYAHRREAFGKGADPAVRAKSQIESIIRTMLDLDDFDERLEASADLGTALHLKIQKQLKEKLGKKVDIEKFVTFDAGDIAGPITGHIDALIKDEIPKVLDIKTVGQHFVDALSKVADATGEVDYDLIKDSNKISANVKQKLATVASQLNLYMSALQQMGEVVGDITAEAQFFSVDDEDLKPIKVRFKQDPERLQKDINAVIEARNIINKYIFEPGLIPEEYIDMVNRLRKAVASKKVIEFAPAKSPQVLMKEALKPQAEFTEAQIDAFVEAAKKVKEGVSGIGAKPRDIIRNIDPTKFGRGGRPRPTPEERVIPKAREDFVEPLQAQFANLMELHKQTVDFQRRYNELGLDDDLKTMHKDIQEALKKGVEPIGGAEFNQIVSALREAEGISYPEFIKAWKSWRIAMGDWIVEQTRQAEQAFELAKAAGGGATKEFAQFARRVERLRDFIVSSAGKQTDIYTQNRRFIFGELAREAGAYLTPEQLVEKSAGVFGADERVRDIFERIVKNLESGGPLKAPVDVVRDMVTELSGVDGELMNLLQDADLMRRMGEDIAKAWNLDDIYSGAVRLREALGQYSKFNLSEAFDVERRTSVSNIMKLLTQVERTYGALNLQTTRGALPGRGEAGLVKVPRFLPPTEQEALHLRNLQRIRQRFAAPAEEGGAEIGERFSYFMKISDQAGNTVKNLQINFKKYGETLDDTGMRVGQFAESHRDLIEKVQTTGSTFVNATRRVVMWGAAATLVYGGVQKLKQIIGELADIEVSIAQLRMVMNPLESDFDALTQSAVGFAKRYGVSVNEVLRGMKIFAQQGLKQAEVISRARVSTLAANVTTLSAAEATEALTASMKSFGGEIGSADRALDAWSETEARHAITAADMANAIKKSAAAAKNAGFTFDELNGIVASIGAVTRQTGKEVGTAMRFIFRRLTSEKGPAELAKIEIPTLTETGELRKGFNVLSDLSMAWNDLTSAQKMNIAQAIGGTRQYNALLVLMDNWDEALQAIEDSTNSKGSAERRNVEIMKTYAKQLEQVRAAATELQMQFGKIAFPIFKTGLKTLKNFLELITNVPGPVKAAGIAFTLFFGYVSKGMGLLDGLFELLDRGEAVFSNFGRSFTKQMDIAKFEIFGKGVGKDVMGLKTIAQATGIGDLESSLGKLAYVVKNLGEDYNKFLGNFAGRSLQAVGSAGKAVENLSDKFQSLGVMLQSGALITPGFLDDIAIAAAQVASHGTEALGEFLQFIEDKLGPRARRFAEDAAAGNQGLVKSLVPLGITIAAGVKAADALYGAYVRVGKSAQDFAQHMHHLQRSNQTQIQSLGDLIGIYDRFGNKLKDINKTITEPGVKERRQAYGTYVDPLLALADLQRKTVGTTNALAESNADLIVGYDKLGNAILKADVNTKEYIKSIKELKTTQAAAVDVNIVSKYIEDLTKTEGIEKWKYELRALLKEIPVAGKLLAEGIAVSPAKGLEVITDRLNELIRLRNKYPLTTAFDEDIKEYQKSLKEIRSGYNEVYADFRRALVGITTEGLPADEIAKILSDERLLRGYELMIDVEPEIRLLNLQRARRQLDPDAILRKTGGALRATGKSAAEITNRIQEAIAEGVRVEPEDVLGAEVLRRAIPEVANFIGAAGEITAARLETAGIARRQGKVLAGDIVTFVPELAKVMDIAGNQAVVKLKKTVDGTFEWFVTYFNSKTLKVEERPFDEDVQAMVNNIFPVRQIQEDLSYRIDSLNEFVAGAAAGLRGIGPKDFKREFNLGERFFAEIPTTTLLQSGRGFNPLTGGFGASPFQKQWRNTIEEFFFSPMREYRLKVDQLAKLQLKGLEGTEVTLAKDLYEGLKELQDVLKNNQVVLQYRAVFVDLTKTIEAGTRTLKENLAIEKRRQELFTETAGLMRGVTDGLDTLNVGIRNMRDLTAEQLALFDPKTRAASRQLALQNVRREATRENVAAAERSLVALQSIRDVAKGFGAAMSPEQLQKYVETVARTGDMGVAELTIETTKIVENTGQTVQKLDDILANMGDPDAVERIMSSISDSLGAEVFDRSAKKTINAMNRIAKIREKAIDEGNSELAARTDEALNRLSKTLVANVGFEKAAKLIAERPFGRIAPREVRQRALTGISPNVFLKKLEDITERPQRTFFQRLRRVGMPEEGVEPALAGSKELERLRQLQEDVKKQTLVDSKTLVKAATALTTFEAFNRRQSSKVINNLQDQEKRLSDEIKLTKEGNAAADTSKLEVKLEGVRKAISREQQALDFHKMVQSIAIIEGGTLQFARALGFSEKAVKGFGAASLGLYAAVKLVSSIMGRELPESAKNLEDALQQAAKEQAKEGEVGFFTKLQVKEAGEKFRKQYEKEFEAATGTERAEFVAKLQKDVAAKTEKLTPAEIEKAAKNVRELAKTNERIGNLQKLLVVAITTAVAGYINEKIQPKIDKATAESLAKQQADVIDQIIMTRPEAAADLVRQQLQSIEDAVKESGVEADTIQKSLVLNTEENFKEIENNVNSILENMVEEAKNQAAEMKKLQDIIAEARLAAAFQKQINEMNRALITRLTQFNIQRQFGGVARLNRELAGYPGEAELPILERDLTAQQLLFKNFGDNFKDSVSSYVFTLQDLESQLTNLMALEEQRNDIVASGQRPGFFEDLEDQIDSLTNSIKKSTESLREFGVAYSNMIRFTQSLKDLNSTLSDMAASQAAQRLLQNYEEAAETIFGGGFPTAPQLVTPEQERMGRRVGVDLGTFATRFEIERAQVLDQLRTAQGRERQELLQRLEDLPIAQEREILGFRQRREAARLREQNRPFEALVENIQRLRQTGGFTAEQDRALASYQRQIEEVLARSLEPLSKERLIAEVQKAVAAGRITEEAGAAELARIAAGGPRQFRGVMASDRAALQNLEQQILEQMREVLPELSLENLKTANEPVLNELKYQSVLLEKIASKETLDSDDIEELKASTKIFTAGEIGKARGGKIFGEGGPKEDKVPAMLSPGEYVIRQAAASKLGLPALEYLNKYGEMPEMAEGGLIPGLVDSASKAWSKIGIGQFLKSPKAYAAKFFAETADDFLTNKSEQLLKKRKELQREGLIEGWTPQNIIQQLKLGTNELLARFVSGVIAEPASMVAGLQAQAESGELASNVIKIAKSTKDIDFGEITTKTVGAIKKLPDKVVEDFKKGEGIKWTSDLLEIMAPSTGTEASKAIRIPGLGHVARKLSGETGEIAIKAGKASESIITKKGLESTLATFSRQIKGKKISGDEFQLILKDLLVELGIPQEKGFLQTFGLKKLVFPRGKQTFPLEFSAKNVETFVNSMLQLNAMYPKAFGRNVAELAIHDLFGKSVHTVGSFSTTPGFIEKLLKPRGGSTLSFKTRMLTAKTDPKKLAQLTFHEGFHAIEDYINDAVLYAQNFGDSAKELIPYQKFNAKLAEFKPFTKYTEAVANHKKLLEAHFDPDYPALKQERLKQLFFGESSNYALMSFDEYKNIYRTKGFDAVKKISLRKMDNILASEQLAELASITKVPGGREFINEIPSNVQKVFERLYDPDQLNFALDKVLGRLGKLPARFNRGGIVERIKEYFGRLRRIDPTEEEEEKEKIRKGVSGYLKPKEQKGVSGYLKPKEQTLGELKEALEFFGGGMIKKRRHYQGGGGINELNEKEKEFMKNVAYQAGIGYVDIEAKRRSPKAMFAEEAATLTGKRFAEEAKALHRARTDLTPIDRMAANIADIQRENRRQLEQDPKVRQALRFPGLTGDIKDVGLLNLTFDRRRGVIGAEGIGKGFQSYYDLNEVKFKNMKREIEKAAAAGKTVAPPLAEGYLATPGADPFTKKALQAQIEQKRILKEKLFDIVPGGRLFREAGLHYGRETEILLPIFNKLKTIVESGIGDRDTLESYNIAKYLLQKGKFTTSDDIGNLTSLMEDVGIEEKYSKIKKSKYVQLPKTARTALKYIFKYGDPSKAEAYIKKYNLSKEQLLAMAKTLKTPQSVIDSISAREEVEEKTKTELSKFGAIFQKIRNIGLPKDEEGNPLPTFHSGGVVGKTGPILAQKGEIIVPKGVADGGLITNDVATAALKEGTIKLEDNGLADRIAEKIKEAIETAEIKVDEDAMVKVDVTDISVPVDIGDAKVLVDTTNATVGVDTSGVVIPVDAAAAGETISQAISAALANVSVDVNLPAGAGVGVGADDLDQLRRTQEQLDDRILEAKDNLETKLVEFQTNMSTDIRTQVETAINSAIIRVEQDVNSQRNDISQLTSRISRTEQHYDWRIKETERKALDAQNFATRPPQPHGI